MPEVLEKPQYRLAFNGAGARCLIEVSTGHDPRQYLTHIIDHAVDGRRQAWAMGHPATAVTNVQVSFNQVGTQVQGLTCDVYLNEPAQERLNACTLFPNSQASLRAAVIKGLEKEIVMWRYAECALTSVEPL